MHIPYARHFLASSECLGSHLGFGHSCPDHGRPEIQQDFSAEKRGDIMVLYVYVYVYVYEYVYAYVYVYMCVYMYVNVYVYMNKCKYI